MSTILAAEQETRQRAPLIGILAWEMGSEAQLSQLEQLPGNVLHPRTFAFPLACRRVEGATFRTIVREPSQAPIDALIRAGRDLESEGVKAITTSCGFNILFQQELSAALRVPFFSSALLLVPLAFVGVGGEDTVGVLTADSRHLTRDHLVAAGILEPERVVIAGLEQSEEFTKVLEDGAAQLNVPRLGREVVGLARNLVRAQSRIGALVLECTDLPPFSSAIRAATGLPTFDVVTLIDLVHASLVS